MVCIVTRDLELAGKLGKAIEGRKVFITDTVPPVDFREKKRAAKRPQCGTMAEWAVQEERIYFRRQLHGWQPEVILLDVTFGRNEFLALEEVPALRELRSNPAVVLLSPGVPPILKAQAVRAGCFDVISMKPRVSPLVVASAVSEAWQARKGGLLSRPHLVRAPAGATVH